MLAIMRIGGGGRKVRSWRRREGDERAFVSGVLA